MFAYIFEPPKQMGGGLPQLSLPVGKVSGCPLGLSLIGPPGRDRALLALARKVLGD